MALFRPALVILLVLCGSTADAGPQAVPRKYQAGFYLEGCKDFLAGRSNFLSGRCVGATEILGELGSDNKSFCLPETISNLEQVRVIVTYIESLSKRIDLPADFRTIDKLRDWLPIRREQCGKDDFRKSKWWRSSERRIAIRWRRWPSGTASASRRSTLGASASVVCRRAMSSARGAPRFLRSDNGPEFVSKALLSWIVTQGIGTALIEPGKPWQNGVAESFNGKFRDECLSLEWFRSRAEAKVLIEEWRRHFNEVRPHSSLGYLTPNEFVARGTRPAPRHATGRDATVYGASAPRPVAQPSPRGQMQRAREAVSS